MNAVTVAKYLNGLTPEQRELFMKVLKENVRFCWRCFQPMQEGEECPLCSLAREQRRVVVCAAIKLSDKRVVAGVRHYDRYIRDAIPRDKADKLLGHSTEGFVDNRFNFLTRQEAYPIALEAGQLLETARGNATIGLHSEDIY